MSEFLLILEIITRLLPLLKEIIKSLEEMFPEKGQGEVKLAVLKEMVQASYEGSSFKIPFEALWPKIEKLVAVIVKSYKLLGIFKE